MIDGQLGAPQDSHHVQRLGQWVKNESTDSFGKIVKSGTKAVMEGKIDGDIFVCINIVLANTNSNIMIKETEMGVTKHELVKNFEKDIGAGSDICMLRRLDDSSDLGVCGLHGRRRHPQFSYQRFHGGLECWRRHHHENTVRH